MVEVDEPHDGSKTRRIDERKPPEVHFCWMSATRRPMSRLTNPRSAGSAATRQAQAEKNMTRERRHRDAGSMVGGWMGWRRGVEECRLAEIRREKVASLR